MLFIKYNHPLANHSAKYRIEFNIKTQETTLRGYLFGLSIANRMTTIEKTIDYEGKCFKYDVKQAPQYSSSTLTLDFAWAFKLDELTRLAPFITEAIMHYGEMANCNASEPGHHMVDERHERLMNHETPEETVQRLTTLVREVKTLSGLKALANAKDAELIVPEFFNHPLCNETIFALFIKNTSPDWHLISQSIDKPEKVIQYLISFISENDYQLRTTPSYLHKIYASDHQICIDQGIKAFEALIKTQTPEQLIKLTLQAQVEGQDMINVLKLLVSQYCTNPVMIQALFDSSIPLNDVLIQQLIEQGKTTPVQKILVQQLNHLPEADSYLTSIATRTKSLSMLKFIIDNTSSEKVLQAIFQHPKANASIREAITHKQNLLSGADDHAPPGFSR
jgi:hypothetical protein